MSPTHPSPVARRSFLYRLSQATAGVSALIANPLRLGAASAAVGPVDTSDPDAWIGRMTGENKVMIHVHQYLMMALVDARNMMTNARESYGVPESQMSLAVLTHGAAIQGLFRDETWQRFALGEFYKVTDPKTGAPATRNVYLTPTEDAPADATVPELMKRGVTFVVCNVALRNLSTRLAHEGQNADAVRDELAAGVVPGAFVVPDLFVSMQRAQKRGVGYIFTDRPHPPSRPKPAS